MTTRIKPSYLRPPWLAVLLLAMITAAVGTFSLYYISELSGSTEAYGQGTFTDKRDGKMYKTVVIGGRRWMAQNLNYPAESSWCYDNDSSNCGKYGRLYNWKTAKRVCPLGWSLPSRREWVKLGLSATALERQPECWYCHFDVLCERDLADSIMAANPECMDCPCFGERLIEGGIEDWYDGGIILKARSGWNGEHAGNGADDYGFSALPGGYRDTAGRFHDAGNYGGWWSATWFSWRAYMRGYGIGRSRAYYRSMSSGDLDMREDGGNKSNGYSVRCIQNGFAPR